VLDTRNNERMCWAESQTTNGRIKSNKYRVRLVRRRVEAGNSGKQVPDGRRGGEAVVQKVTSPSRP
jgi:hypothetical protein